jgi:sodium borate transporter 11
MTYNWYFAGFVGNRTLQKTASTTVFLYFACILPNIALGVLNDKNTDGAISAELTQTSIAP